MKRIFYTTVSFLFVATALFANSTDSKLGISSERDYLFSKQDSIELVIDLGDLEGLSHAEITDRINSAMTVLEESALHCTVIVKGVVKTSEIETNVEIAVSGSRAEVKKEAGEIADYFLQEFKNSLSKEG